MSVRQTLSRFTIFALLASFSISTSAAQRYYGYPPHQAQWIYDSSPVQCVLRQNIPLYGYANFEQRAGRSLNLSLYPQFLPRQSGEIQLRTLMPSWRKQPSPELLAVLKFADTSTSVFVQERAAKQALLALQDGKYVTFGYLDWHDSKTVVTVFLSSVNIRAALQQFYQCLSALLPGTFEELRHSAVYFRSDSVRLDTASKELLVKIAAYAQADDKISRVLVSGHADSSGELEYNDLLAKRRAQVVGNYLLSRGVMHKLLREQSFGMSLPYTTNETPKGRKRNRRVVVELIR